MSAGLSQPRYLGPYKVIARGTAKFVILWKWDLFQIRNLWEPSVKMKTATEVIIWGTHVGGIVRPLHQDWTNASPELLRSLLTKLQLVP